MEAAHSMLLRHHQQTQDLEYRQQRAIHALKEEQVGFLGFPCVIGIAKEYFSWWFFVGKVFISLDNQLQGIN